LWDNTETFLLWYDKAASIPVTFGVLMVYASITHSPGDPGMGRTTLQIPWSIFAGLTLYCLPLGNFSRLV